VNDPSTYWLTFTNIALGAVVLICSIAVAVGVVQEIVAARKRRAAASAIDRELAGLAESFAGNHAFNLPNLGVTMADGGEELRNKERRSSS